MIDDAVSRSIFGIFFAARSQGPLGAKASLPRFAHAGPKSDNVDNEETCFFVFCVGEEGRDHSKAMPRACKPYMYSRQPPTLHAGKSFNFPGEKFEWLCQPHSLFSKYILPQWIMYELYMYIPLCQESNSHNTRTIIFQMSIPIFVWSWHAPIGHCIVVLWGSRSSYEVIKKGDLFNPSS